MNTIGGGVTAPQGFRASGVQAGVKPGSQRRDCALIVSDALASAAGVFTRNAVKAAPVRWCQALAARGAAQAVFVNSGNANACTGGQGEADARATAQMVGEALDLPAEHVAVCSTGVIGVPLPMERIGAGVRAAVAELARDGSAGAAEAIMTTDTRPKERAVEIAPGPASVRIGAIAKGSGMIAPNMATMLAFLTTDAVIGADLLNTMLRRAVDASFNAICVDNDTSTNDTVLALANGRAGGAEIEAGTVECAHFEEALTQLCVELAQDLVRDGEGAGKFVTIRVTGAASAEDARRVAKAIAMSQLCKTAFFGEDPNWGRIACAAGYSGAAFDPGAMSIRIGDVTLMKDGCAAAFSEEAAAAVMKQPAFTVEVCVGDGGGEAQFWTSDLSYEYVRINADYRS